MATIRARHFIAYRGVRFYEMRNGYYHNSRHGLLHRYVWTRERGPIPDGWHIHHRFRGDKATVDVDRLECLPMLDHERVHPRAYDFHSKGGRASWAARERRVLTCGVCGESFESKRLKAR